ncbi:MAG TPA: M56 family metallopeptidase [Dokdonella sp.]|uniref:M56 family metallopeptidase n=1 Tax=Dokdonella sp. TaxID=2291710 RepID=UPI002CC153AF|nr:M56 family metallopeptidase [Dokdonella sp.]HUD43409.1 M56 family metallopeptidase [Dokdonella sp.]
MIVLVERLASALATLAVHATLLLAIVWSLERLRLLRSPQALECAWRFGLFGALLSTAVSVLVPAAPDYAAQRQTAAERSASIAAAPSPSTPLPVAGTAQFGGTDAAMALLPMPPGQTPATKYRPAMALTSGLMQGAVAAWLAGLLVALLVFVRRGRGLLRLRRGVLVRGQAASPPLLDRVVDLAARMHLPVPAVRVTPAVTGPMALPHAIVLLPRWSEALSAEQQRAMLAHELAHLQRRDPYWRIVQHAALLPLFFHPLAWHARRRLESLAEDACDAAAADLLGSGRPLAECLATCLSHAHSGPRMPTFAATMAHDASPVVRRVQRLLEETPMSIRPSSAWLRGGASAAVVLALLSLPGIAVTTAVAGDARRNVEVRTANGTETIRYRDRRDGYALDVEQNGTIDFNADESDVARLANGADLTITETVSGVTREIGFKGRGDAVERRYRVDGTEQPLDADGRAWVAAVLPRVLRESGAQAEARGGRLLARGGADALLAEIDLIQSDHARAAYLRVLFAGATLAPEQQRRALALTAAIGSDYEKRNVLQGALEQDALPANLQVPLLRAAAGIGSDYERAELLSWVAERLPLQGEALDAWSEAVRGIGSDFERRRVIEALLERGPATPAVLVRALDDAGGIGSDFEKRSVLDAIAAQHSDSADVRAAYLRLASGIGSDFERRQALLALLDGAVPDAATTNGVLAAVETMDSDFEARQVLVGLARVMPGEAGLIARYRKVARGLDDFERGQAEKALDRFDGAD